MFQFIKNWFNLVFLINIFLLTFCCMVVAEELSFEVDLYDFVSGTNYDTGYTTKVDSISFSTSTVRPGLETSQWASGKTFAKVSSNLTSQSDATIVYMYTTNSTSTGTYKAVYPKITPWEWGNVKLYRGLVIQNQTTQGRYEDGDFAPITVLCVSTVTANANYMASYPTKTQFDSRNMGTGKRPLIDYADIWENGNPIIYSNDDIYIGKGGATGGLWTGTNTYINGDVIIFFGAEFDHVYTGAKYGTETIRFSIIFDPYEPE